MTRQSWPGSPQRSTFAKQDLTSDETSWAMAQIMAGEATSAQIAAFVIALRAKVKRPQRSPASWTQCFAAAQPSHC